MQHQQIIDQNRLAWEEKSYEAWVTAYGKPEQLAIKLVNDPKYKLRRILPYLDDVKGKRIANPLGSHGRLAVSLALLGAKMTVIDISSSNQKYALELAEASNVNIEYIVGDFIQTSKNYSDYFDQVIMELGILHYFVDLQEFVNMVWDILKSGGTVILNEFHPLMKKAITVEDGGVKLFGDYFQKELESAGTPYNIFLPDEKITPCMIRRWNLGEIITAFAEAGFTIRKLVEEPSWDIDELPGTFTLIAEKS